VAGAEVNTILRHAWEHRELTSSELRSKLQELDAYIALMARLKAHSPSACQIVEDQVTTCVRDLKNFCADPQPADKPELQYKVRDGKICYKTLDTVSSDIEFGYRYA
jgi:hypothetical protein